LTVRQVSSREIRRLLSADNTTAAFERISLTTAPGIWMAIYDPLYDLGHMITHHQLFTAQIDANSYTVVNIGLAHYRYLNKTSNYRYRKQKMSIESSLSTNSNHRGIDLGKTEPRFSVRCFEGAVVILSSNN
jgi:hypothetical protein